jgi:hypothetical protein
MLQEQIALLDDPTYTRSKRATRKDKSTGERTRQDVQIKVKSWLSPAPDADHRILSLRYGNAPIEVQPGKSALIVQTSEIRSVLTQLVDATVGGELDTQLGRVSQSTKQRFKAKSKAK